MKFVSDKSLTRKIRGSIVEGPAVSPAGRRFSSSSTHG
jgi:hypothetical protein